MHYALTFVASGPPLTDKHIRKARKIAQYYNILPVGTPLWLAPGKAADLVLPARPSGPLVSHLREDMTGDAIDVFFSPIDNRRKKLLLADMESTIVNAEALDELAGIAGIRDEIADITHKAMEGRMDFRAALLERVRLLKGLSEETLGQVLDRMLLNQGAKELVHTMKRHGASCVLVSGGFTFFTQPIAKKAGFDHQHGNILGVANGKLSGTVEEPILDKDSKLTFLKQYVSDLKIGDEDVLSIGDGANDIPMLKAAGLGIGYHPKEAVAREIDNLILHGDLSAVLYIQGYKQADIMD